MSQGRKRLDDSQILANSGDVGPDLDESWVGEVREKLVRWYEAGHRDLPWRRTRDAYAILVSEMMLIQTTVETVIPKYSQFLERFPDLGSLADAPLEEVLKVWEGLGYYRRARSLWEAAGKVEREHGGNVPSDVAELMTLPGVGRYVAGAVASFAYGVSAPILEANTQRVVARLIGSEDEPGATATMSRYWRASERLVPPAGASTFNQAFMELGATICIPKGPRCLSCPLSQVCLAYGKGMQDVLPRKATPKLVEEGVESSVVIVEEGRILMMRRGEAGLWSRFWELPTIHRSGADPARRSGAEGESDREALSRITGLEVEAGGELGRVRYGVTRYRMETRAVVGRKVSGDVSPGDGFEEVAWVPIEAVGGLVRSSPQRKLWDQLSPHFCRDRATRSDVDDPRAGRLA